MLPAGRRHEWYMVQKIMQQHSLFFNTEKYKLKVKLCSFKNSPKCHAALLFSLQMLNSKNQV